MKFLVDAHLPRALCRVLAGRGHDAVHTLSLPNGNATGDEEIRAIAVSQGRVLITKDLDFFDELVLRGAPPRLVLVRCGNMRKGDLLDLFSSQIDAIVGGLENNDLVELTPKG